MEKISNVSEIIKNHKMILKKTVFFTFKNVNCSYNDFIL